LLLSQERYSQSFLATWFFGGVVKGRFSSNPLIKSGSFFLPCFKQLSFFLYLVLPGLIGEESIYTPPAEDIVLTPPPACVYLFLPLLFFF